MDILRSISDFYLWVIFEKKPLYAYTETTLNGKINALPHGVLATFNLTAGGLLRPPEEGNISREKTILMTSLQVL